MPWCFQYVAYKKLQIEAVTRFIFIKAIRKYVFISAADNINTAWYKLCNVVEQYIVMRNADVGVL